MRIDIPQAVNAQYAVDTRDPNIGMKQVIQGLGAVSQAYDIYETSVATNNLAQHEQKLSAIENELTASDRIDLSNPVIPEDVRKKVTESPDYKQRATTTEDGRTFIPTSMVMTDVMNDYKNKAFALADESIGGSKREQYKSALAGTFQKSDEKISKAQHAYVATEVQGNYLNAAAGFAENGDYEKFVATLHEARGIGVLDQAAMVSKIEEGRKVFGARTKGQVEFVTSAMGTHALQGNEAAMAADSARIDDYLAKAVQGQWMTAEEAAKLSTSAKTTGTVQLASGNIMRAYQSGGIDAAESAMLGYYNNIPEGIDAEKYQSGLRSALSDVSLFHKINEGDIESSKKELARLKSVEKGKNIISNNQVAALVPDSEKDINNAIEDELGKFNLNTIDGQLGAVKYLTSASMRTRNISTATKSYLNGLGFIAAEGSKNGTPESKQLNQQLGVALAQLRGTPNMGSSVDSLLKGDPYLSALADGAMAGIPSAALGKFAQSSADTHPEVKARRETDVKATLPKKPEEYQKQVSDTVYSSSNPNGKAIRDYMDEHGMANYAPMLRQWDEVYKITYINTGNPEVASNVAGAIIRRDWRVVKRFGVDTLEKSGAFDPVEYDGSTEWAKTQERGIIEHAAGPNYNPDEWSFVPDQNTQFGDGKILMHKVDGVAIPYRENDGSILRWNPDPMQDPDIIKSQEELNKVYEDQIKSANFLNNVKNDLTKQFSATIEKSNAMNGNDELATATLVMGQIEKVIYDRRKEYVLSQAREGKPADKKILKGFDELEDNLKKNVGDAVGADAGKRKKAAKDAAVQGQQDDIRSQLPAAKRTSDQRSNSGKGGAPLL